MTGFDNRDRLRRLLDEHRRLSGEVQAAAASASKVRGELKRLDDALFAVRQLSNVDFAMVDLASASEERDRLAEKLRSASDPDSDAGRAMRDRDSARGELDRLRTEMVDCEAEVRVSEAALGKADAQH